MPTNMAAPGDGAALIASGEVAALIASGEVAALIASGEVAALIASGEAPRSPIIDVGWLTRQRWPTTATGARG